MSTCDKVDTNQLIFLLNQQFFYLQNINSIGFELDVNESTKVTKKQVMSNEFNRLMCC
jgi:hypothetical protein